MRHKNTKAIYAYWLELLERAQSPNKISDIPPEQLKLPERSDVEPTALRSLLGDTFILDRQNDVASYRLAGTRICSLYGRELKGEAFTRVFEGQDSETTKSWASTFGRDVCLILICSEAQNRQGDTVNLETLMMPLAYHQQTGERALGLTVPLDTPYWLGEDPIVRQTIRSIRIIRPWEENIFRANWPFEMPEPYSESPPSFSRGMRRNGEGTAERLTVIPPRIGDYRENVIAIDSGTVRRVKHLVVHKGGRDDE